MGSTPGKGGGSPGLGKGSGPERWTYAACIGICRGKSPPWSPGLLLNHKYLDTISGAGDAGSQGLHEGRERYTSHTGRHRAWYSNGKAGWGAMGRRGGDTHHTHSDTESQCNQLEGG